MGRPAFDLSSFALLVVGYALFGTPKEPVCSFRLSVELRREEFAVCFSFADGQVLSKERVLGIRCPIVLPPIDLWLDIVDRASLADVAS